MGKILGGGKSKSSSTNTQKSGFAALPGDLQNMYRDLLQQGQGVLSNPAQYFAPMDITGDEQAAQSLIQAYQDPQEYRRQIETLLSPYRDVITEDINEAYQDQYSGLKSRASEAGAFGSSRMRGREADLEQSRLGAIARAMQGQYNVAQNQMQQNIGNLLGFGGLQRNVDLAQRQAPVQAMGFYSDLYRPILNTGFSTQTQTQSKGGGGLLGALGPIAGLASGISGVGANLGLWGGYDPFTGITWNSGRVI